MRTVIIAAFAVLLFSSPATAAKIKGTYVGCITEDALDEWMTAASKKDYRQAEALMGKVCFFVSGLEYSVVEVDWSYTRIRVYVGDDSAVLWVLHKAASY